jgi:hypothetical protein
MTANQGCLVMSSLTFISGWIWWLYPHSLYAQSAAVQSHGTSPLDTRFWGLVVTAFVTGGCLVISAVVTWKAARAASATETTYSEVQKSPADELRAVSPLVGTEQATRWLYQPPREIFRRHFHDEQVPLDGFKYIDCTFSGAVTFVYDGLAAFDMNDVRFEPPYRLSISTHNKAIDSLLGFLNRTGMLLPGQIAITPPTP